MPKRRVLAICSDPDQLRRIVGNLEHAGADVDAVRALDASDGASIEQSCVVLALGEGDMAMVSRLAAMLPPRSDAVIVTPRGRLADFTQYLADPRINHVLAGAGDEFDLDLAFTARKIVSGDIFGAEKYLAAGAELQYARLHDYDGRNQAIDGVLAYAESVGMRRQVRTAIGQVCEELLMNALYDAPVDAAGKQVFADLDPRERSDTQLIVGGLDLRVDDAVAEKIRDLALFGGGRGDLEAAVMHDLASVAARQQAHGTARRGNERLVAVGRHVADFVHHEKAGSLSLRSPCRPRRK